MKTKLYFKGVAVLSIACLMSSCAHYVTWQDIRGNPEKYVQQVNISMKGRIRSVGWNTQEDHGELTLRDPNGDTGPEPYVLLHECTESPEWWEIAVAVPVCAAGLCLALALAPPLPQ